MTRSRQGQKGKVRREAGKDRRGQNEGYAGNQ